VAAARLINLTMLYLQALCHAIFCRESTFPQRDKLFAPCATLSRFQISQSFYIDKKLSVFFFSFFFFWISIPEEQVVPVLCWWCSRCLPSLGVTSLPF